MMRYFYLLPLSLFMTVLAYFVGPVLPLIWESKYKNRFSYFWWPDNDIDGDRGWRQDLPLGSYWRRLLWCWKNPAYNFEIEYLGAHIKGDMPISIKGDIWIKNRDDAKAGWYFATVGQWWNFKWIVRLSANRCFMFEAGWKLQDYLQHGLREELAQFVFSPRFTAFNPEVPNV